LETTSNALEQALIHANEPDLNEQARTKILMFLADGWHRQAEEGLTEWSEDIEEEDKKKLYVQKYSTGIPLAESILIDGTAAMFLQIIDGKAILSREILLPGNISLRPWDKWSYLNKEYSFSSLEEINDYIKRAENETIDSLYNRAKSLWKKYEDMENLHIVICAADTIFTYFQDRLGLTHYLLFVGDNDVGKTNNLKVFEQIGYRALLNTSLTPANIYRSLGSIEAGQVILLEDEADNIEEQDEKMRICKTGYDISGKVARSDDTGSGGRKSQAFYTYCFKAFASEKQPDSIKAKGFNDRVFVIKCSVGDPDYDISEVISPAGDKDCELLLEGLVDLRKLLLIYRLLHYNDPIPNVELNIKNRDKQLCKPLIRLFQGTRAEKEVTQSLSRLLKEKKERKANTIEARLHHAVTSLIEKEIFSQNRELPLHNQDIFKLAFTSIWTAFVEEVDGVISLKPQSIETTEYGTISQKSIVSILKSRFGAEY